VDISESNYREFEAGKRRRIRQGFYLVNLAFGCRARVAKFFRMGLP